jgi:hypothetical protein
MAAVQDNSIDERVRIPETALTKLRVLKKEISHVLENA